MELEIVVKISVSEVSLRRIMSDVQCAVVRNDGTSYCRVNIDDDIVTLSVGHGACGAVQSSGVNYSRDNWNGSAYDTPAIQIPRHSRNAAHGP